MISKNYTVAVLSCIKNCETHIQESFYHVAEFKKIFSQIQNWNKGDFTMHIGGGLRAGEKKADMMNHFLNSNSIVY